MSLDTLLANSHDHTRPVVSLVLPHTLLREQEIRRIMAVQLVINLTGGSLTPAENVREDVIEFAKRLERFLNSGG